MKLRALVNPRADGTVIAEGLDNKAYTFEDKGDGLVGVIDHEETVVHLLRTSNFEPADAEDFDEAIRLMPEFQSADAGDEDGASGNAGSNASGAQELTTDPDDFEEVVSPGGLLVEANTPPKASNAPKAAAKGAKKSAQ